MSASLVGAVESVQSPQVKTSKTSAVPKGYRPGMRDGKYVYCRSQIPTGTVLRREVCLTSDELRKEQSDTRRFLDARANASSCGMSGCGLR
jgi:hypothetical protein